MNQTFKQKAVVASIAAALSLGVVAPASANLFADTTLVAGTSAGVAAPVSASAALTDQVISLTETAAGSVYANTGNIVLTLDNGKWKSIGGVALATTATDILVNSGGFNFIGSDANGNVGTTTATEIEATLDSTGKKLTIGWGKGSANLTGVGTINLSKLVLDTTGVSVGTAINVSVDSTSTLSGLSKGASVKVATVTDAGVTTTSTDTTLEVVPKGAATTLSTQTIKIVEALPASLAVSGNIKVTLPSGVDILSAADPTDPSTLTVAAPTVSSNVATYAMGGTASTSAQTVSLGTLKVLVPASFAAGDVSATVEVPLANGTTATTTVKLFSVADKGTTNTAVKASDNTAVSTYATLYAGRATQDTTTKLQIKELVGDTLIGSGTVILDLPSGVTFGKNYTATEVVGDGTGVNTTPSGITANDSSLTASEDGKSNMRITLGTDAGAAAGSVRVTLNDLDLADTATVGDLSVAVSGNAGATAGSVKVAEIKRATESSVSGTVATAIQGATIALGDVVITEQKATALLGSTIGYYVDPAVVTLKTTGVTVKAYKADGTDTGLTITPTVDATNGVVSFTATATSTTTGAYTYKVTGVTGTVKSNATSGDISAVVGGLLASTDTSPTSDEGGKAYKQTVVVGKVASNDAPTYPAVTVADSTKAVISGLSLTAAGKDQGKPGAVYVAFIYSGTVFFMDSTGAWTTYTGKSPASYFTGSLTTSSIDVLKVPTDLSSLKGGQLIVGYGLGLAGLSDPFNEMLNNTRYNILYTVK